MTSSPHGLYAQGYTRATMAGTKGSNTARWSESQKAGPSSDWSLQLDSMKSESLVIADQQAAVNTFSGLVQIKGAWQFKKQGGDLPAMQSIALAGGKSIFNS